MIDSNTGPLRRATVEEDIRQWWNARFDTPLPEDVKQWLRETIRTEVSRQRMAEHRLDDMALQKVREGRRLCQTKLDNVEDAITRVRQQLDRLHRFIAINAELTEQKARLYQINKQQASLLSEQRELERYEEFEPINGRFQRIHTQRKNIANGRQMVSQLVMRQEGITRQTDEAEKAVTVEMDKVNEAMQAVEQAARVMADSEKLEVQIEDAREEHNANAANLQLLKERLAMLQKERMENTVRSEGVQKELSALRLRQQALEAHRTMILQGGAIQVRLDRLLEAKQKGEQLSEELNQAQRRQNERDEQLGRLFAESQTIDDAIRTLKEEVAAHRASIAGQDSFTLQRRALELRSRKQMLETGFSLWRSISAGYDMIEYKEQLITQLRLHADHLNYQIDALDKDVRTLSRQQEQKTYHWTLSKSQNVVQLRGDLEEGTPCSVCGATHHPWQGETETEQNALISSLKADCEAIDVELRSKRQQLEQLQSDLTATQAKLEVENLHLEQLRERQKKDTDEWQNFSSLDRSFIDCSPSTNREARTAMIQQLIEKTAVDAEEAEKNLNAFTFHLDSISTIGNDIQHQQQRAADLAVRLNEVNTACQVMAGHVERLSQQLKTVTQTYSRRYEALEKLITIPEWFKQWRNNHESVKQNIQQMMDQWELINEGIHKSERDAATLDMEKEQLERAVAIANTDIALCEAVAAKTKERLEKAQSALAKLLPANSGVGLFQDKLSLLQSQRERLDKLRDNYLTLLRDQLAIEAQRKSFEEANRLIETENADEQRELDLWIQRYNANNPPVQMAELERLLADGRDWSNLRQRVRAMTIDQAITQARVDRLRSQIISLQADGLRPIADSGDNEQDALQTQLEELEQQRRKILQQLANLDEQLRLHEQTETAF